MADVDEPQFTTLAERIAALNQAQVGRNPNNGTDSKAGRKPSVPTPAKPSAATTRPQVNTRSKTANNPLTLGLSSLNARENNEPNGVKPRDILPPPTIDRDFPKALTPVSNKKAPPPLPQRTDTKLSPALPPRRASEQLSARRNSNDSTFSQSSSISSLSMGRADRSSISSVETTTGRKLPPAFDQASLPPLPPTRRESEANKPKTSVLTQKSSSIVPQIKLHQPTPPPALPSRSNTSHKPSLERKLPPPFTEKNEGSIAQIPQRSKEPPPMPKRAETMPHTTPQRSPTIVPPQSSRPLANRFKSEPPPTSKRGIVEISSQNSDSVVLDENRDVLVDYYLPYCKHCIAMEPEYEKLSVMYEHSDKVTIAKLDCSAHKTLVPPDVEGFPTIRLYPARAKERPVEFSSYRTAEAMSNFIAENGSNHDNGTGVNNDNTAPPSVHRKPSYQRSEEVASVPPPIPRASRPSLGSAKPQPSTSQSEDCLICRDFSGPDSIAARYPRLSNPDNSTDYLAEVLCGPFTSLTDKARAIFTWLHHNIDYDVAAFFGNNLKHASPENTIASGLAVCEGYARLYMDIALRAGLECVLVTGHGKGFGYDAPKDGEPVPPPNPTGHAWNAVRIDDGEWKLIDACWGAGHVGNQQYHRKFNPSMFTSSNEDFGRKHFPANGDQFYRKDRRRLTWDEYIIGPTPGEPLQLYGCVDEYGISNTSFLPPQKNIPILAGTTRFQFNKICLHWDFEKNGDGKPFYMILQVNGLDGRERDFVPMDYDGYYWFVDVTTKHLGCTGQSVNVYAVTTVNGVDARGMTKSEYLGKKGKVGMGFNSVATWNLR